MSRLFVRIYATLSVVLLAAAVVVGGGVWLLVERDVVLKTETISRAGLAVMARELARARADGASAVEAVAPWSGTLPADPRLSPLEEVLAESAFAVGDARRERLLAGQVVAVFVDRRPTLHQRLAGRDEVLRVGPLPAIAERAEAMVVVGVLVFGLALLVAARWRIRPLEAQLDALARAADALGRGDRAARAPVLTDDDAGQLAQRFNAMAAQVDELVRGRERLLHAVSHELRTPLARLRFGVELLGGEGEAAAREARRARLEDDLAELDQLLDELLTWARLDAGASVSRETTDAARACAEAIARVAELRPAIALSLDARAGRAALDPRLFRRALQNLLVNALRHATAAVTVTAVDHDDALVVTVDDDGPGVPIAERARILEAFVRGPAPTSHDVPPGGSGLGLAIASRAAAAHGGAITVSDAPGGGARFTLRVPRGAGPVG
jgi:signal transduction histidine kinase